MSYTTDFEAWRTQTAQLLRQHRWSELDLAHLIAEVEDLGKSERRGIASQLTRLLIHCLKWQFQPHKRSDSWLDSITDARTQIALALDDSPSLRDYPSTILDTCYVRSRRQASQQTGLAIATFPVVCPYAIDNLLEETWLPHCL